MSDMLKNISVIKTSIIVVSNPKIVFPEHYHNKIQDKINKYVEAMNRKGQSNNYYEKERNAVKPSYDGEIGKWGEYYVSYFLYDRCGFPLVYPENEIREGSRKGWVCDLEYPNIRVHVKTCTKVARDIMKKHYGDEYSWTLQEKNKYNDYGKDILFQGGCDEDLVAFVYIEDIKDRTGYVIALAPWYKIKNNLVNPHKKEYIGLKKCVNYKFLRENSLVDSKDLF